MLYQEVKPSLILQPFVVCYWIMEFDVTHGSKTIELMPPTGFPELLFNYGDTQHIYFQNTLQTTPQNAYLTGLYSGPFTIQNSGRFRVIGVKFKPLGAFQFSMVPLQNFTNTFYPLELFMNRAGGEIFEKTVCLSSSKSRIEIIEYSLKQILLEKPPKKDFIEHALALIHSQHGAVPVTNVARLLNVSTRHLHRSFQEKIGINPKLYARIVRFNYVVKLLKKHPHLKAQDLAFEGSFFDQAHFIKNFKEFTHQHLSTFQSDNLISTTFFLGR